MPKLATPNKVINIINFLIFICQYVYLVEKQSVVNTNLLLHFVNKGYLKAWPTHGAVSAKCSCTLTFTPRA